MKDEELEKTKPIEVLSELSRSTKYEDATVETREEKYSETNEECKEENELIEKNKKEEEEKAEEALAEKNITEAEAIIAEDMSKNIVTPEVVIKDKKENSLKKKWSNLPKKKKVLIIVIILLVLVLAGILVFSLFKKEEPKEVKEPEQSKLEEAPVIVDNFYFKDGKLYFTNDKEEVLGNYECENKDSNLCYVAFNSYRDSFDVPKLQDESGKEIVQRLNVYEDRFVFIIDHKDESDSTIKLFSMTDNKLIGTYISVRAYEDNYIIVEDTAKNYGLLQINDGVNEIISPQYEYLGMVDKEDKLIAKNKKGYVVVDKSNKVLSSPLPGNAVVKSYNNNMIVVTINNEYNVYDYKANLIAGGYAFASVKDDYVALVDSNKKLYIRNMDKTKYNEGDIQLENNNYVRTYIYDKEGSIKKVKRSYDLNIKEESIEVAVYDNQDDVTYENVEFLYGKANMKYAYVNYFKGKLYFYKDIEKEELIGSYTCSNKNYIDNAGSTYNSCFIANDTVFEDNDMMSINDVNRKAATPIINNAYVFINDGTNNVKLYDLLQGKALGTYSNVNTYTKHNDYAMSSYIGNIEVVGKNKKGKYGVLAFDENGVTAKYTFDYEGIEKIGNYYQITEDGEEWQLMDNTGSKVASFKGKVMEFSSDMKHFKTIKNKKYSVANEDGSVDIKDTYVYVDLYSKFYAGVDDKNNIYIYDYDGKKLSEDAAKASSYPFSKAENRAIKVTKTDKAYVVSVYNGTSYDEYELEITDTKKDES